MENRSITYLLLFGICSMLFVLQSCQETDDLRSEIDSLKIASKYWKKQLIN